jgi:hypothetical protein
MSSLLILKSKLRCIPASLLHLHAVAQGLLQLACERMPPCSTHPSLANCVSILCTTQRAPASRCHKFTPSPSFEDGALLKPLSVELAALERANPHLRDAARRADSARDVQVARGWDSERLWSCPLSGELAAHGDEYEPAEP